MDSPRPDPTEPDPLAPQAGTTAPLPAPASTRDDDLIGRRGEVIGLYVLLEPLGEGGFGTVWLAERRSTIVQRVALKLLKPGMDSRAVIARFEQERQALAVMDHPNVAKVLDAGTTPAGRPYFVMEHVAGEPITTYCDRHRLDTRSRLELFIAVCEAIQHAHTKGIVHRDIKPSNILVAVREGPPIPKVIDFGIAKAMGSALTDKTIFTEAGQMIGTPEYMSPEQAEMGATDLDTRTDVYSLGVLLYELLTGLLPFDAAELRAAGFDGLRRMIREREPARPSVRLAAVDPTTASDLARRRQGIPEILTRQLRRELEWIPLRAMRKDRTQRYRTAAELADDVRRYLAGQPLIAGPESITYQIRKFLKRRRGVVAAASLVLLTLAAGIVGTATGMMQARAAARAEATQRHRAEAAAQFLRGMLASVDPAKTKGKEVTVREILAGAAAQLSTRFADQPEVEAALRDTLGASYHQLGLPREAAEQFDRALLLRQRSQGEAVPEYWTTAHNLAAARLALGQLDDAKQLLTTTLHERQRLLGAEAEDALATQSLLAQALQLSGEEEAALQIYRDTVAAQARVSGPTAAATLDTKASIADVLRKLGQLEAAEREAAALVEAATAAHGADHLLTLTGKSLWAAALRDLSQYAAAETQIRDVLAARRRILGPEHGDTLVAENVLGQILEQLVRYDEAAELLRHASEASTRTIGADHNVTLSYRANLARVEQLRGRLDEAEQLMLSVLEAQRKLDGEEAESTLTAANNYALLLLDRHKPELAEPWFRRIVDGLDKALPSDHWLRGQARMNLGECLFDLQRYPEAEAVLLEGYGLMVAALQATHARCKQAAGSLVKLYRTTGRPEQQAVWQARAEGK